MLNKVKLVIATSIALVGGVAGFAAADRGGDDHGAMKEKFDTNKDGKLDDAERAKAREAFGAMREAKKKEMLATFDTNKNGTLEDAEKQAMHDARAQERFTALDTNRDGKLTIEEFKAGMKDRDHDHGQGRMGRGKHRGMGPGH
jgi:hypothetical protein